MRDRKLKTRVLSSFVLVILVLSLSIALLGFYVIDRDIISRAQERVNSDLETAHIYYSSEIDRIGQALRLVDTAQELEQLRQKMSLDYLRKAKVGGLAETESEIVQAAFQQGRGVGGSRIISRTELDKYGIGDDEIIIKITPMARQTEKKLLKSVMSKEYALPVWNQQGQIDSVIYGGRIINRDYTLVDRISKLVFGQDQNSRTASGTVTIFQDDTRIATNVLTLGGERAIGTIVSEEVYFKVVEQGQRWHDRAFVVNAWYKTAYEPITNIDGDVIGMLYVGIPEQPFQEMARNIMLLFLAIVVGATMLAVVLSFILAGSIWRPLTELLEATKKLTAGHFEYDLSTEGEIRELNVLSQSFNEMARELKDRETSLNISNQKLEELNKSYVDLIGFVAHELKGILASAIINAYSIRDGFLGMINFKQRKAIDSVTRNLDYLEATVKKFLNLGRIEKGEMQVHKSDVNLRKDVFDVSINALEAVATRKNIQIDNQMPNNIIFQADADLLLVVANNLLSNAIKYGIENKTVLVKASEDENKIEVEVYNDSNPITEQEKGKLFQKFSRLENAETKKVKGTGLGLFVTREIIEAHGGRIWVEPRETGNSFIFELEREPSVNAITDHQEEKS